MTERRVPDGAIRVVVSGVGVEVVHRPCPGRPTLVFLHEGLGSASMWRAYPQRLAERSGCGWMVYSRQGYGGSDPIPLPRPLTYMHLDGQVVLPSLLEQLQVADPILYGHSDGASIALIAAGGGHVSTRAMILEAPHVFREAISLQAIEETTRAYQTTDLRARLMRHHGDNVDGAFWGWSDAWRAPGFGDWNLEGVLAGVHAPVLLFQGRADPYGTLAQIDAIASQVSGPCMVEILDDCGHAPHRERTDAVLERAARFLLTGAARPQNEQAQTTEAQ
ncbi:MAG: alpha/beta hydrolase [Myxococcota bacterium]